MSAMDRLKEYVYSPRNIAGCGLALTGLLLLFAGVIDSGWPWIVAGLYAAGALGWPRSAPPPDPPVITEIPVETLVEHLQTLVEQVSTRIPAAALASLQSVQSTLTDLLPRLRALEVSGALSIESSFTVEETLRRYLPEMLSGYLKLPSTFAQTRPIKDGQTAAQILIEQLQLLDESLKQIAQEAFAGDAEALVNSGRFLERKFRAKAAYQTQ